MKNLLSAQYSRLFRSKTFYLSIIFFILMALFYVLPGAVEFSRNIDILVNPMSMLYIPYPVNFKPLTTDYLSVFDSDFLDAIFNVRLDADYYLKLNLTPYIVIIALLVSLLIGRDFSNNTIRNKLIAGYSRISVYLSNLIVCLTAGVIMQIIYVITAFVPIFILYLKIKAAADNVYLFNNSFKDIVIFQLAGFAVILVYTSIFLMFTMISSTRTHAVLASLVLVISLMIGGEYIDQTLYPSDIDDGYYTYSEYMTEREESRGKYLGDTERKIYGFLDDVLTIRQTSYLTHSSELPLRTGRYFVYDALIIAAATSLGMLVFSRKDLK